MAAAGVTVIRTDNIYLGAGLFAAAVGFIANYFTCFCGTKKTVSEIRKKF